MKKIIIAKSKEVRTGCNLTKSLNLGYESTQTMFANYDDECKI
jgi:hypothetical protein